MREKYKSYTFKPGEPESHVASAQQVCNFVEEFNPPYFTNQREPFGFPDDYQHEFDIVVRKTDPKNSEASTITHFIEIGDIGDDSKHNPGHKSQLIKDGLAKDHVVVYYPDAKYVKINKDDCYYKNFVLKKKLRIL